MSQHSPLHNDRKVECVLQPICKLKTTFFHLNFYSSMLSHLNIYKSYFQHNWETSILNQFVINYLARGLKVRVNEDVGPAKIQYGLVENRYGQKLSAMFAYFITRSYYNNYEISARERNDLGCLPLNVHCVCTPYLVFVYKTIQYHGYIKKILTFFNY